MTARVLAPHPASHAHIDVMLRPAGHEAMALEQASGLFEQGVQDGHAALHNTERRSVQPVLSNVMKGEGKTRKGRGPGGGSVSLPRREAKSLAAGCGGREQIGDGTRHWTLSANKLAEIREHVALGLTHPSVSSSRQGMQS